MNYFKITKEDMLNGDGLRVVLWVAGCEHNCPHCHNKFTHNPSGGSVFDKKAMKELLRELDHDYISGLTLSGGDPLHPKNRTFILYLANYIKRRFPKKTIWLYTGYKLEEVKRFLVMSYIDVLVDGKFNIFKTTPSPQWCGSSNQRVFDVSREHKLITFTQR